MGLLDGFKKMGNTICPRKRSRLRLQVEKNADKPKSCQASKNWKKQVGFGHRRLGSTASTVSGDCIKVVWANNKDSSHLFDKLGAKDIFKRFNCFLENWKAWQDSERFCKEILGFDLEMKLVESLCHFPTGMRLGLGCGSSTEEYDFYLDVDPVMQLSQLNQYLSSTFQKAIEIFKLLVQQMKELIRQGEKISKDLIKIVNHFEECLGAPSPCPADMQQLDNPEQLKEALILVKDVVLTLKSYGRTITEYIMQQGHNVDIVILNKQSTNPTLAIFPKKRIPKVKVQEMKEKTFINLNHGDDDEKYIEISLK